MENPDVARRIASLAVKLGDFVEKTKSELGRRRRMKSIAVVALVVDSYRGPVLKKKTVLK